MRSLVQSAFVDEDHGAVFAERVFNLRAAMLLSMPDSLLFVLERFPGRTRATLVTFTQNAPHVSSW
jgi:hypothetical protein